MILVLNHVQLESGLEYVTGSVLSAAEMLVAVSGVVVGIVFGRRWLLAGPRATSAMLLRRARKLYLASVVVVGLVAFLTLVPGIATDALAVSPTMSTPFDTYSHEGLPRLLLAIVTLEAGPWQFNILGFFIVSIALAPVVLFALARGRWPFVLAISLGLFLLAREFHPDLLPMQSERPFPFLIWQLPFVAGIVVGWHRERLIALLRPRARMIRIVLFGAAGLIAAGLIAAQVHLGADGWSLWERSHLDKGTLDPARLAAMAVLTTAVYLGFRRLSPALRRVSEAALLPLGQNSFYVFIMHVFVCLAIASLPLLSGPGFGLVGNTLVEVGCLALLWLMVRHRFLFRWVPR